MIIVTGGAGFIGSRLIAALNNRGEKDILVVDRLGTSDKWKNLRGLAIEDYLDKGQLFAFLESPGHQRDLKAVFHLGACSSTTETRSDYLMENNYRYSLRLAEQVLNLPRCRLIYASSAATYGDGRSGFRDVESDLNGLQPLNMYGYSKHLFDLAASRRGWLQRAVGLKYFNVFGPNEDHKGEMRSLVAKAFPELRDKGVVRLFESGRPDYAHGGQIRDFIYVDDAVEMTLFFHDHPEISGLFNIGSGQGRTFNDLAGAMFKALDLPLNIEYIPMPERLGDRYQYYTQANLSRLWKAGCRYQPRSLETAVNEYINGYLLTQQPTGRPSGRHNDG